MQNPSPNGTPGKVYIWHPLTSIKRSTPTLKTNEKQPRTFAQLQLFSFISIVKDFESPKACIRPTIC